MQTLTRLRPTAADHTLVRLTPDQPVRPTDLGEADEMTAAVYRLLADTDQPMPVMELAARLSLPRVVAITIVTTLARHHLVQLSAAVPPASFLARICSQGQAPVRPWSPGLVSAKVVVVGAHRAGASTYVGAVSDRAPVRTLESARDSRGSLIALSLELGAIELTPSCRLHLLAAPAPTEYDALWPGVIRSALGAVVVVHPYRPAEAVPTLLAVQDAWVPFQVVVNHLDGIDPDPGLVASTLDVDQEQVTVIDARSRPATRSSLHQLLRRLEVS
ncbi:hypothetical protein [Nocardiopsis dassonvillei]|uniref:hypothetical protein n=1 Tax=Nocardiopsis dassonvillei TaxID=2014 RepID=UPI0033EE00A1